MPPAPPALGGVFAPTNNPLPPAEILSGVDLRRPELRRQAVARLRAAEDRALDAARRQATAAGLPLRQTGPGGTVVELAGFLDGRPLYRTTHNANAAISTGADLLQASPYSLGGTNLVVGVWDGGAVRSTHREFGARVTVMDGAAVIDHATHVAGTIAAAGVAPAARGMGPGLRVDSYDWNNDLSEMTARGSAAPAEEGTIPLSNHSYGYITGWRATGVSSPAFIWYGASTNAASVDAAFGQYNSNPRGLDLLAASLPYYLIFRSAGNDRTENPTPGQTVQMVANNPATTTYDAALHPAGDGNYRSGFDTISHDALAKNVLTVGSTLDAISAGQRAPAMAAVSSFSSWGPTDDGRIKPDVVANGDSVYSPVGTGDSAYGTYWGTSMATPNAAGTAALLVEQHARLFPGSALRSASLKGLLIHTADDRGTAGPDYKFGWGLVHGRAAADLLRDHAADRSKGRLTEGLLTSATNQITREFVWDGLSPIKATLVWTDPAGPATTTADSRTAVLRNNLDLRIEGPDGTTHRPFIMPFVGTWTPASADLPATTGVNNTDNVEQVRIDTPAFPGTYRVIVSRPGSLEGNQQAFSLLLDGSAPAAVSPALTSVNPTAVPRGSLWRLRLAGTPPEQVVAVKLRRAGQPDLSALQLDEADGLLRTLFDLRTAAPGAWAVELTTFDGQRLSAPAAVTVLPALWSESFEGETAAWSTASSLGTNSWGLSTALWDSDTTSAFIGAPSSKTTTRLVSPPVAVPAGATGLQLRFRHAYDTQANQDGGRLEVSADDGVSWVVAGAEGSGTSFAAGGYNATISNTGTTASRSELAGQQAWSGNSGGYATTVLDLDGTAFAGRTLRFRWVFATNASIASTGWSLDTVVFSIGGPAGSAAPLLTSPIATDATGTVTEHGTVFHLVAGSRMSLTVSATDDGGEEALTYHWTADGDGVAFTPNTTGAARTTTASFSAPGDRRLSVVVSDAGGLSASDSVRVRVVPTLTTITVEPGAATVPTGGSVPFTADLRDQFGQLWPASPAWSASGGGTIDAGGLFTATTPGGPFTVTASAEGRSGTASVTVVPASTAFAQWLEDRFGSIPGNNPAVAAADDADGDGLPNLLEYALGLDPQQPAPQQMPIPTRDPLSQRLRLVFNRVDDPALLYEIWASDSPGAWEASPLWTSSGADNAAGPVLFEDPSPLPPSARRFLQLRVRLSEP